MDALAASSSLTTRRQAASSLPNFELPPPNALHFAAAHSQKYPPLTQTHHPASAAVSVGNLLTPPSNSASDNSAASSNVPTGTSPNSTAPPVLPYTPTFFGSGGNAGFHSGLTPQGWQTTNPLFPPRPVFSPMSGSLIRHNTNSTATGEGTALPPPPYDLSNGSYPGHFGLASPPGASLSSQPQNMTNPLAANGIRPPSQQSPVASDPVGTKPPAPSIYTNMPPSHVPSSGYSYSSSTPVSQSPHSASGLAARHSPQMNQMPTSQQSQSAFIRAPYPSYTLPNMPGPAMSNITSPGAQMSMVGNVGAVLPMSFNSGYVANTTNLYGSQRTNSPVQNPQNDRPFRCDSCPQSFHRNHDLKRHKRIHLAVKPFPCKHCDKSFSRKDALKRHILVKGCGNRGSIDEGKDDGTKSESGSDQVTSPVIAVGA
ncbi:hypothetical protein DV736_g5079, partial [Chaetothyriales sp. CBS 134916]